MADRGRGCKNAEAATPLMTAKPSSSQDSEPSHAASSLCRGTDDDFVDVNLSRLLDRERNRARDRRRRYPHLFRPLDNLGLDRRIRHGIRAFDMPFQNDVL